VREDYYGADYTLQLQVRDSTEAFELRPQDFKHEVVLGRSAGDNSVRPDVDLSEQRGSELGVSRLHLGLRYDGGSNAVHVYDLGSANGSFINNQRLNPREVRFLRDGDQLRLGRLVMSVKFVQGT
jgi:pSer/pThr/pTyr-binding forkhead associated (FHA) protein